MFGHNGHQIKVGAVSSTISDIRKVELREIFNSFTESVSELLKQHCELCHSCKCKVTPEIKTAKIVFERYDSFGYWCDNKIM